MKRFWKQSWFLPTTLLSVAMLLALATSLDYFQERQNVLNGSRTNIAQRLREAAIEIDRRINTLVPVNIELSEDITSGRLAPNEQDIVRRLEAVKNQHPHIFGVGVAYVPGHFPNRRLYGPLLVTRDQKPTLVQIEDIYDYTDPDRAFFHRPLNEGPVWQEPHYGQASQAFIANFTAPFFDGSGDAHSKPIGVVFTSMSLDQYQDLVGRQDFGNTGFGFLLSAKGAFVSHPNRDYVETNKTLSDWIGETATTPLLDFVHSVTAGVRAFVEHLEPESGALQWVFTEPIISTGWTLGAVFNTNQIPGYTSMKQAAFRVKLSLGLLLAVLLALLMRRGLARARSKKAALQGAEPAPNTAPLP